MIKSILTVSIGIFVSIVGFVAYAIALSWLVETTWGLLPISDLYKFMVVAFIYILSTVTFFVLTYSAWESLGERIARL